MRIRALFLLALAWLAAPQADAAHRGLTTNISAQGNVTIGVGSNDLPNMFLNALVNFQSLGYQVAAGDTPHKFDANGFPIAALSADNNGSVLLQAGTGFTDAGTTWVFKWRSGRNYTATLAAGLNVTNCFTTPVCIVQSGGGQTFSGGGTSGNCTSTDPYLAGSDWCRIEFNFVGYTSSTLSYHYPSGAQNYAAGTGSAYLVRKGQDEACLAGQSSGIGGACISSVATPEFIELHGGEHPGPWRTLGLVNVNSALIAPQWAYRTDPAKLSYLNDVFPPSVWAGVTTGQINCPGSGTTCSSDAYVASANTDFPTLVDGAIVQGVVNFDQATNNPTLNYASSGAIPIFSIQFSSPNPAGISGQSLFHNELATFVYNATLNAWIHRTGGISAQTPIEARATMAKNLNTVLWDNIPMFVNATWIVNEANAAFTTLNPVGLGIIDEADNEDWNPSFAPYFYYGAVGAALGWPNNGLDNELSFQSLRTILINNALRTSSWGASTNAGVISAWQSQPFVISSMNTDQLQSSLLDVNVYPNLCTYLGFTFSGTCSTNPHYNSAPNRAGDISSFLSYASYFNGTVLNGGCYAQTDPCGVPGFGGTLPMVSPSVLATLTSMQSNYLAGGSGITAAKALVDDDVRHGSIAKLAVASFSGSTITMANVSSFTGSVATNNVLTASAITGAALSVGQQITGAFMGAGQVFINSQLTGPAGGNGTYTIAGPGAPANLAFGSEAMGANEIPNSLSVTVSSTGTLPTPLTANTAYFTVGSSAGTVQLAATVGGSPISLSGGSGTLSIGIFGDASCQSRISTGTLLDETTNFTPCFQTMMTASWSSKQIYAYEGGFSDTAPTAQACSSLGLGNSASVTYNASIGPTVTWTGTPLHNGDRFAFTTAVPGVQFSTNFYVMNQTTNGFDISTSYYNPVAQLPWGVSSGSASAIGCQGFDNLRDAYMNDATLGFNIGFAGDAQFTGLDATANNFGLVPNNKKPGQLATSGFSQWSSCGAGVPLAQCTKVYAGIAAFSLSP